MARSMLIHYMPNLTMETEMTRWVQVSYKQHNDTIWSGNDWTAECGFGDGCYDAYNAYDAMSPDEDNKLYRQFETAAYDMVQGLVRDDTDETRQFTVGGITWDICLGALWDK